MCHFWQRNEFHFNFLRSVFDWVCVPNEQFGKKFVDAAINPTVFSPTLYKHFHFWWINKTNIGSNELGCELEIQYANHGTYANYQY